ncbi:NADP-dependent oxidoreductase [Streptomyces sp. NPDC059215]|uniref:NADP-dependent oxidoreductase n=1 Tax=Streptomyces sp. NPDC059215 TaxID=3346772 RepID=UPI00367642FA
MNSHDTTPSTHSETRPKMRAIVATAPGGPEVLTEVEVERPTPGPTEILVRVHAAGVNPIDWYIRTVGELGLADYGFPAILGFDVSGTVEAVGLGVTHLRPGDEVFGMPQFPQLPGGYAEYVTAPARRFTRKPATLSHVEAAALPLAALTAWQSLVETARLAPGERVLIHAAAGGVGHLAVQIAKEIGAYVIGTARTARHDFLRNLGADELIDYTITDFTTAVHDVDVVLDTVGGDYGSRSLQVIRPGGTLISLRSPLDVPSPAQAAAAGVHSGFTLVEPDSDGLQKVTDLVEKGSLRPQVDVVLPLASAAKAHAHGEQGGTSGKIVLSII